MAAIFAHNRDSFWVVEHLPPDSATPNLIGLYSFLPLHAAGRAALEAHTLDRAEAPMTKPLNIRRFANLLSADNELGGIERSLKRGGERREARRIADVREILARALSEEQACRYETLMDLS